MTFPRRRHRRRRRRALPCGRQRRTADALPRSPPAAPPQWPLPSPRPRVDIQSGYRRSHGRADGDAGNGHAFDQNERIAFHDHAVGERAAVAFVGIADDVFLFGLGLRHGAPFDAGQETGAAAAAQARLHDFSTMASAPSAAPVAAPVAIVRAVILERARIDDAAAGEGQAVCCLRQGMSSVRPSRSLCRREPERREQALGVFGLDRTVGDAARRRLDLHHRFQPVEAARAVAHDLDRDLLPRRRGADRAATCPAPTANAAASTGTVRRSVIGGPPPGARRVWPGRAGR